MGSCLEEADSDECCGALYDGLHGVICVFERAIRPLAAWPPSGLRTHPRRSENLCGGNVTNQPLVPSIPFPPFGFRERSLRKPDGLQVEGGQMEDELFVRMLYNGRVVRPDFCQREECPLRTFKSHILQFLVPQNLQVRSGPIECGRSLCDCSYHLRCREAVDFVRGRGFPVQRAILEVPGVVPGLRGLRLSCVIAARERGAGRAWGCGVMSG